MRSHMAVTMAWTSAAVEVPLADTARADWLSTKVRTCWLRRMGEKTRRAAQMAMTSNGKIWVRRR